MSLILKAVLLLLAILVGAWPGPPAIPTGWRIAICAVLCVLYTWLVGGGLP